MRYVRTLLTLLALTPCALAAQEEAGHIGLVAGRADWDLNGTGHDVVYGLRVGAPINRNIGWEINVSYFHPDQNAGPSHFFIPELQLQLRHTWNRFTPFLGVGAGAAIDKPEDRRILGVDQDIPAETDFAPSFSLGARYQLLDGLSLQAEGRLHGIEADFDGTVTELTGGLVFLL